MHIYYLQTVCAKTGRVTSPIIGRKVLRMLNDCARDSWPFASLAAPSASERIRSSREKLCSSCVARPTARLGFTMLQCPSLKDRVFRSHKSIHVSAPTTLQRGTYKPWTESQMDRALQSVVAEGMSIRRAAAEHNVPKSSLADRVSGRTLPGTKSGPPPYLNASEEQELVQFLTRSAAIGYGKSRKEVIALVQCIVDSKGIPRTVRYGQWESFCRRHPNISLRSAAPLSLVRRPWHKLLSIFREKWVGFSNQEI